MDDIFIMCRLSCRDEKKALFVEFFGRCLIAFDGMKVFQKVKFTLLSICGRAFCAPSKYYIDTS